MDISMKIYLSTTVKFIITSFLSFVWLLLSAWLATDWILNLAYYVSIIPAILIIAFIALIPGFMYMFLLIGFLIDKRPTPKPLKTYPDLTILIAAYNEEEHILKTLSSVKNQDYLGKITTIVIDDGSTDNTYALASSADCENLLVLKNNHEGKSSSLNLGLKKSQDEIIITIDADTYLAKDSITQIVAQFMSDPPNTAAIAGSVYVKNSRSTLMTRMQEWEYFHSIAAIKRNQSLFQGTLVAQGAFSIYRKKHLLEAGGWSKYVGEDIVLTWFFLQQGYRVGFCEKAFAFTNVPTSYKQFFHQRSRWARGMFEALVHNPKILFKFRPTLMFVCWNLLFPFIDFAFLFLFVPGVIAAFFGYHFIAGPMTLAVLPLAFLSNLLFYVRQRKLFRKHSYKIRSNKLGLIFFILTYQLILTPAIIHGYLKQLLKTERTWGTKK